MRRRFIPFVFAAMVVSSTVPASAAEPEASPSPDPTTLVEPSATPAALEPATPVAPAPSASPAGSAEPAIAADVAPVPDPALVGDPVKNGGLDVTDKYIVVLKQTADTSAVVRDVKGRDGVDAKRTFKRAFHGFTATLDRRQRAALLRDSNVVAVVPDEIIQLAGQTMPTGVSRIGGRASPVAKIDGNDERVDADVAIVDTGVGPHADLNVVGGYNCSSSDRAAWADDEGHGTHVAGTVAALDNDFGVVGVAPGARIWAVKILNSDGYGLLSWYVCGLDWILAQRDPNDSSRPLIEAVNMSVTKTGTDDQDCGNSNKDILHQAICRLVAGGITVVAAAANDSASATHRVPASYDEVITVSALADTDGIRGGLGGKLCYSWGGYDSDDTFANFSNYGYDVDLIAPGKCIWSTRPNDNYGYSSGTSMAAPAVTGAVALYKSSRPYATPAQVKEALQYLGTLDWKTSTDPDSHHEKLLDVSRLGPLGTFGVGSQDPPAAVGEAGGAASATITIDRSPTFFERIALKIGSLPSGWTAKLDKNSLIGWTADATTLRLTLPKPTPAGTYHVTVTGTNQGRSDATTVDIVVENDPPTARPAVVTIVAGRPLGTTTSPVTLAWPSATDATSDIAGYEVQVRKDGGAWGPTTATTARSIVKSLAFDHRYDVQVRARDAAGNWSPWVVSPIPFRATVVDDRKTSVKFSSSWVRTTSSHAIADTLRRSSSRGAAVSYSFIGRGISVVAPTGPGRASVAIRIDGVLVKTVSLKRGSTHHREIIFSKTFSSSGSHRISLQIVSSGKVQLDAFVVAK